jgi:hypothetical protein
MYFMFATSIFAAVVELVFTIKWKMYRKQS